MLSYPLIVFKISNMKWNVLKENGVTLKNYNMLPHLILDKMLILTLLTLTKNYAPTPNKVGVQVFPRA